MLVLSNLKQHFTTKQKQVTLIISSVWILEQAQNASYIVGGLYKQNSNIWVAKNYY